jgi:hypothetical protein
MLYSYEPTQKQAYLHSKWLVILIKFIFIPISFGAINLVQAKNLNLIVLKCLHQHLGYYFGKNIEGIHELLNVLRARPFSAV